MLSHFLPTTTIRTSSILFSLSCLTWSCHCVRAFANMSQLTPTLTSLIEKSASFPIRFPIESVRCSTLSKQFPPKTLEDNINSAYPVIHEKILPLIRLFLKHKSKFGTEKERKLYEKMSIVEFVDRLLKKRPVMFMNKKDSYILLDDTRGDGNWESIGTDQEQSPLVLQDYLSYDEIKLSAFLSVSSHTVFINDGNRQNRGLFEPNRTRIEENGVIVGLIGPRLSEGDRMEHLEIVKTKRQNVQSNGFGTSALPTLPSIFCGFYGESSDTYESLKHLYESDKENYVKIGRDEYFSIKAYKKRIELSVETLFIEANHRASSVDTSAYIHVVGLGLGVWKVWPGQNRLFLEACIESLTKLGPKLHNVSDVCFAYIRETQAGVYKDGDKLKIEGHPNGGITIHIKNREPHEKLTGEDAGKLLVVSYASDGNAFPGNEFWNGSLDGSGDPAAASSTQVAELHNPCVNSLVCGANLKIATADKGVIGVSEYMEQDQFQQFQSTN